MVFGMPTTKITITLPDEQIQAVRALVAAGQTTSVSAFVKHAVGIALFDAAGWRDMLREALLQTGGPLTRKERGWADQILSPKPPEAVREGGRRHERNHSGPLYLRARWSTECA
jgi:Arc/MetJ-type ribon-helix-helix transcriptional regulator